MADHQMRVYQFGLLGDLPAAAIAELRRAHQAQNKLVEFHLDHADRVRKVWETRPELAELAQTVDEADSAVHELVETAKKQRVARRTTRPDADTKRELAAARKTLREAKAAYREAKAVAYPTLEPLLAEANSHRKAAIKAHYRVAVDDGLYWATWNEVVAHHETARKQIAQKRKNGLPADLRFRRWDGTGTLAVQLQRETGSPARTPATIADPDGRWQNVAHLTPAHDPTHWAQLSRPEQRKARHGTFRWRIGSGEHATMVEMPVLVHRPIPPDADITMIRISRRILAGKPKVTISVIARIPSVPQRVRGQIAAVHTGWRVLPDDSLRVAIIDAPHLAPPPAGCAHVVRWHDGWGEVIVPPSWRHVWERTSQVRSQRDRNLDVARRETIEWLAAHPDIEWPDSIDLARIGTWRSPGRFVHLAWTAAETVGAEPLAELLSPWQRQDRHLWQWEANERDQIIGRRDDAWRNIAAWITSGDTVAVAIDEWAIQRRKPAVEVEDPERDRHARSNAVIASPGRLRETIRNAAAARGVHVTGRADPSHAHLDCGHDLDLDEGIMARCPACDTMVDQDRNAAAQLRASATVAL